MTDPVSKPTPTPEEIDKARLGIHVSEKEPDGSPEEHPNIPPGFVKVEPEAEHKKSLSSESHAHGYKTRDLSAERKAEYQAHRKAAAEEEEEAKKAEHKAEHHKK